jgi:hypothetical protein
MPPVTGFEGQFVDPSYGNASYFRAPQVMPVSYGSPFQFATYPRPPVYTYPTPWYTNP